MDTLRPNITMSWCGRVDGQGDVGDETVLHQTQHSRCKYPSMCRSFDGATLL
jgi:hypothetical protein